MPKNEIINSDPFADVQLEPISHRGKDTDKFVVAMRDEEQCWQPLSGLGAVHSGDYTLVPNQHVFDLVGDVLTRTGASFKPIPSFGTGHSKHIHWDGRKFSAKWFSEELGGKIGPATMALGVEAVNSYDGSAPVGIRFFAMNCICSNQFYCRHMLGNMVFRHINSEAGIQLQENAQDALTVLQSQADHFIKVLPALAELRKTNFWGFKEFLEFREKLNAESWKASRDGLVLDELTNRGRISPIHNEDMDAELPVTNYWRILNAYTAVTTHHIGGFNGAQASDAVITAMLRQANINVAA